MSQTVANARAIQARLSVLMGSCASGSLLVRSTGPEVLLPAANGRNASPGFATPISGGALIEDGTVFVRRNPARQDGNWVITSDGVNVPVEAVQGGIVGNYPAGTEYRWSPAIPDLEPVSISSTPIEGGVTLETPGAIKQLKYYKQLSVGELEDIFRAQVQFTPAVVLAWAKTAPLDGPMAMAPGRRQARMGPGKRLARNNWFLYLITSRIDGDNLRLFESDQLRDDVVGWLNDATMARGLRVSGAPGAEVPDAGVWRATPTNYVDLVQLQTRFTQVIRSDAQYNDWLNTRIQRLTEATEEEPPLAIPDVTVPMEFDSDEDEEGDGDDP